MKKLFALAVILFVGFMTNGPGNLVFAQQTSIKLFDARPAFDTGPQTSPAEALPFANTSLILDFAPGDTAVISSTPDGTGSIVIDNFMTINGVNACEGVAGQLEFESCFGPVIDPALPTGEPIETVLTPIPPVDVSTFMRFGTTTVTFELRDFGVIAGNTDLFLVTTGTIRPRGGNFALTRVDTPVCDTRTARIPFFGTRRFPLRSESTSVWKRIVQDMLGVEGWNPRHHFIDEFAAEKDQAGPGAIDNWWPLDEYKHALCGRLDHFNFYFNPSAFERGVSGARQEADWNNFFIPNEAFAFLLEQPKPQYLGGQWHDCAGQPASCIEAEITPDETYFENILNSRRSDSSVLEGHSLCTYGPWVREKVHDNRPEIHPSELYWWVEQNPSGVFRYFLMQVQDDSDRFDRRNDYGGGNTGFPLYLSKDPPESFRPWTQPPLAAEFRIAFELNPAADPLQFDIFRQDARHVVTSQDASFRLDADDGIHHAIEYDGRIILSVTERQPADDDLGVGFLGVCRDAANTRLQGYITIRSMVGVNDRGNEGYHTVRVETNKLPYLPSTPAPTPPVIPRAAAVQVALQAEEPASGSLLVVAYLPESLSRSPQNGTDKILLVADFQVDIVDISGDPGETPTDRVLSVALIAQNEVRELAFKPDPDGGGVVKDVHVSESATLLFSMESGIVEPFPLHGFTLAPQVLEHPPVAEPADPAMWPELARIAGGAQATAGPPGTIEHVQTWQLDLSPVYAPLREGQVSPGEESPFTEEINEAIVEHQEDRLEELFGTPQPFTITWSFQATNLSTNKPVPVRVGAAAAPTEVHVQLLHEQFPNGGAKVTFPAQPADQIYEVEAAAQVRDTTGAFNTVQHRFWSHIVAGDAEQLADNMVPAVAELASVSAEELMAALQSDISGSPRDEVEVPDDIVTMVSVARMVRLGAMDTAGDGRITIDELRGLIGSASLFEPVDSCNDPGSPCPQ